MNPNSLHAQPFLLRWAAARAGETMDLAMVVGVVSRHQLREAAGALGDVSTHLPPTHQICQPRPCPFTTQDTGQHFGALVLAALPESIVGYGWDWACLARAARIHTHSPNCRTLRSLQIRTDISERCQDLSIKYLARRRQSSHLPSLPPCPGAAGSVLVGTGRRW